MLKKILRIFAGLLSCYFAYVAYMHFAYTMYVPNQTMTAFLSCYASFIFLYSAITGSIDPFFTGLTKKRRAYYEKLADELDRLEDEHNSKDKT
jgi:hypothetical protein